MIGRLSKKEGTSAAHHGTFDKDDVKKMREKVKWDNRDPFHIIPMVYRFGLLKPEMLWQIRFYNHASKSLKEEEVNSRCNILQGNAKSNRLWRKTRKRVVL